MLIVFLDYEDIVHLSLLHRVVLLTSTSVLRRLHDAVRHKQLKSGNLLSGKFTLTMHLHSAQLVWYM